jgi:hypothetical protein
VYVSVQLNNRVRISKIVYVSQWCRSTYPCADSQTCDGVEVKYTYHTSLKPALDGGQADLASGEEPSVPIRSLDSVVGITTAYGLDGPGFGVRVPVGARNFSSQRCSDPLWGPRNLLSNGYKGALSPGVKRPGR